VRERTGRRSCSSPSRQDTVQAAKKARDDNGTGHPDRFAGRLRLPQRGEGSSPTTPSGNRSPTASVPPRGAREGGPRPRRRAVQAQGKIKLLFSRRRRWRGGEPPGALRRHPRHEVSRPAGGRDRHLAARRAPDARARGSPRLRRRGVRLVVCDRADADKYRALLREGKEIESRLAAELESHLNAEITRWAPSAGSKT